MNGERKPVLVLLAAALALILPACSGDGASDGGGGEKDRKEPGASSHDVGQRVTTGAGNKATVHAYEQPYRAKDREEQLDPGNEFASIDVETCAGSEDAATDPRQWQLLMPDNRRPEPELYALPIREPEFPAAPLPAGECVRGWITFQVPTGTRAADVVNVAADPQISWNVGSDQ